MMSGPFFFRHPIPIRLTLFWVGGYIPIYRPPDRKDTPPHEPDPTPVPAVALPRPRRRLLLVQVGASDWPEPKEAALVASQAGVEVEPMMLRDHSRPCGCNLRYEKDGAWKCWACPGGAPVEIDYEAARNAYHQEMQRHAVVLMLENPDIRAIVNAALGIVEVDE